MKYYRNIYLFLFVIYLIVKKAKFDLPVHCLSSKIEGNWMFYLGDNIHDKDLKCGHKRPDQNLDHYDTDVDKVFKHKFEILVRLERPDKVIAIKGNKIIGKWTMIYDEGFEFTIYDQVFFAFNRYKKVGRFSASNTDTEDTKGYVNICNKTFLGWYHNKNNNLNWGCFWGEKIEDKKLKNFDLEKISYRNIFMLKKLPLIGDRRNILSGNEEDNEYKEKDSDNKDFNSNYSDDLNTLKINFLKNTKIKKKIEDDTTKKKTIGDRKKQIEKQPNNNNSIRHINEENENLSDNSITTSYSYVDFLKSLKTSNSLSKYNDIPHLDIYFLNNDDSDGGDKDNFLEINTSTKYFQPDYNYVNKINDPKNNYTWKAKIHDDFIGKSYSQMRNLLGNVNFFKSSIDESDEKFENSDEKLENNFNDYEKPQQIEPKTEKDRLITNSKEAIKQFLEFGSFLELDIDVQSSSFLTTTLDSESLTKNGSKNEEMSSAKENQKLKNKNKKAGVELESEEGENYIMRIEKKNSKKSDNNDSVDDYDYDIEISDSLNSEPKQNGKYGKLPTEFDWRNVDGTNYDSPIRKQGECGSCYAIAATSVLESRIRIKSNNRLKPLLSPSSILSCSRYNQGCYGGYPYLVGKFGKEFGFVDESCQPYSESDDKCFDFCFHEKKWKVKSYGYVGGYYGGCDEESIMREIYENGPIIVALNATPELYYYSKGIFNSEVRKIEGKYEKNVKPWEYTNHAVVCIGWGEETINDNTVKYWILKNSWGTNWGDKGYFKLTKGVNMASIEAQGVFITPDLDL